MAAEAIGNEEAWLLPRLLGGEGGQQVEDRASFLHSQRPLSRQGFLKQDPWSSKHLDK